MVIDAKGSWNKKYYRLTIIITLIIFYIIFGLFVNIKYEVNIIYSHFAYIPIVLSGIWWGRKSLIVAAISGLIIFSFYLLGISKGPILDDIVRASFFMAVAFFVGVLSENVRLGHKALTESEERYRLLIENALSMTFLYVEEKITFVNSTCLNVLGYEKDELLGRRVIEIFHKDHQDLIRQKFVDRNKDPYASFRYEVRILKKNGEAIWVDLASKGFKFKGVITTIVNAYDITDRKNAEKEKALLTELARDNEYQLVHSTRLAELGEMAAAIAHEINQPLTGIRNFAKNASYMITEGAGSKEEVNENLLLISAQVDRAAKIINKLRELTRKSEKIFTKVNINNVLNECIQFLTPQLKSSKVTVITSLQPNLPEIEGEKLRLEQVFLNIITNARQALEDSDERRLEISTKHNGEDDSPVIIEISDTGIGFDKETSEKIFKPFFSTKKVGHGTGLGLSISMTIIKDHGGTISARGESGKGATFIIKLPKANNS